MKFSKFIVVCILLITVIFTFSTLYVFYRTGGEPTGLIEGYYKFFGVEFGILGVIKVTDWFKAKKGDKEDEQTTDSSEIDKP